MTFDGRILSGVSVLAAVVEGGSFVKAAELIGLTDSGVSRAINRLERRLGVRLLDRTTRSVALTDEGRRFYDEVKPHLNAIEDAAIIASGAISAVRGRLKVDIDPFFLPMVLAGRLGPFCERYPELYRVCIERAYRRFSVRGRGSCDTFRTAPLLESRFAQAHRSASSDRSIARLYRAVRKT
jgi:DNA-binding transcriptional LysR family regulator